MLGAHGRRRERHPLRNQLLRSGGSSIVLKAIQIVLMLGVSVVLARSLGAEGYGVYAFAFALIELFGLPGQLGVVTLVVREVARYQQQGQWARLKGVLHFGLLVVLTVSLVIMLTAGLVAWLLGSKTLDTSLTTLLWGLLLLPLASLTRVLGAALRGLKRITKGLVPESLVQPGGFLLLCGVALLTTSESWLTPDRAMLLHVIAAGFTLLLASAFLIHEIPVLSKPVQALYDTKSWLSAMLPLTLITGMQVVNSRADLVMLGIFGTADDVGIYRVVIDSSLLVLFGLKAINMAVAPHLSSLWASQDLERLQRLVTSTARVAIGFALPIAIVLIVLGKTVLSVVFGTSYGSGSLALTIIVVGQLVNAAFGCVALLLNMTGHERLVARGLTVAALSNVALNLLLIPMFGIEGAAVATVVTLGLWNLSLWRAAMRHIGVNSLVFASATVRGQGGDRHT